MRAPRSRWQTWSVFGAAVRPADLLLEARGCALRLVLRLAASAVGQLPESGGLGLRQVESIDLFGGAEVRGPARDHDPRRDRDQLDHGHRDAHVRIDHETLV